MARAKRVDRVAWVPEGTHPDVSASHYRSVEDDNDPLAGDLVVWIDDAPNDPDDPSGHFEVFKGDDSEYKATSVTVSLEGQTNGSSATGTGA